MKKLLIALLAAFTLSGCAVLEQVEKSPVTARIVVSQVTMRYIEGKADQVDTAIRVATIADDVRTWLDLEGVTVPLLKSRLLERLAKADLSPSDRALANDFAGVLSDGLEQKIGAGPLDEQGKTTVNTVLDWVISATQYYR